jgi:hypothetical protein
MDNRVIVSDIINKAHAVASEINTLCDALPTNDIRGLSYRLRRTAFNLPVNVERQFLLTNKIERLRNTFILNGYFADFKEYLQFLEVMNVAQTDELQNKLQEIYKDMNLTDYVIQ